MSLSELDRTHMSALLINAPPGRHFAQLHRDSATLARSVGLYAETGLRRGNGVVLIAVPEHVALFMEHLSGAGLDPEESRRARQLVVVDAATMLSQFMRGGMPDWESFRRATGAVLQGLQGFGRETTRAYGEMVSLLWEDGRARAAIRLEEYWNELARLYPFSLFCCYTMDHHAHEHYDSPLHEIGRTHSEIVPTEEDARFRDALDAASKDVFGVPLSQLVVLSGNQSGESRLPAGQRTMLWISKTFPNRSATVLELARRYYAAPQQKQA